MQKIKEGALFSIGFTVVAIAIAYAVAIIVEKFVDSTDYSFNDPADSISIVESRVVKREEKLVVLGKYKNTSDSELSGFKVNADFFGPEKLFLDQCDTHSSGSLLAGQEAYFKINCSSCADLTLDDVASHSIYITSRY